MAGEGSSRVAYAVILPYILNELPANLAREYSAVIKRGVTFAESERKALNNALFSRFSRNRQTPPLILHNLKEVIQQRSGSTSLNGLDELLRQGAEVYDIPEVSHGDGSAVPIEQEKFDRRDILASSIAEIRGGDSSDYTAEALAFVEEAMSAEAERRDR